MNKTYKYIIIGVAMSLIAIVVVSYFPKFKDIQPTFTEYKPLTEDSILSHNDSIRLDSLDTMEVLDSTLVRDTLADVHIDTIMTTAIKDSTLTMDIFHVNTSYDDISKDSDSNINRESLSLDQSDAMIFGTASNEVLRIAHQIDNSAILKIIAPLSAIILTEGRNADIEKVLDAVVGIHSIESISVANKDQVVIYSTNKKYLNRKTRTIHADLEKHLEGLWVKSLENNQLLALPIYNTYGRIGSTILNCTIPDSL